METVSPIFIGESANFIKRMSGIELPIRLMIVMNCRNIGSMKHLHFLFMVWSVGSESDASDMLLYE